MKETRTNFRWSKEDKNLIEYAAKLKNDNLSHFVLKSSTDAAKEVIAEQKHFDLKAAQWDKFCKALDEKPKKIKALSKLLATFGVFDE